MEEAFWGVIGMSIAYFFSVLGMLFAYQSYKRRTAPKRRRRPGRKKGGHA